MKARGISPHILGTNADDNVTNGWEGHLSICGIGHMDIFLGYFPYEVTYQAQPAPVRMQDTLLAQIPITCTIVDCFLLLLLLLLLLGQAVHFFVNEFLKVEGTFHCPVFCCYCCCCCYCPCSYRLLASL